METDDRAANLYFTDRINKKRGGAWVFVEKTKCGFKHHTLKGVDENDREGAVKAAAAVLNEAAPLADPVGALEATMKGMGVK